MNQKCSLHILLFAYLATSLPSMAASSSTNNLLIATAGLASALVKGSEASDLKGSDMSDLDSIENDNATATILAPEPVSSVSVEVTEKKQSTFDDSSQANNDSAYECRLCKITFFSLCEIESHFKDKHLEKKKFECKYCKKEFKLRHHLISHIDSFHNQNNEFPCLVLNCPLFFKHERARNNHICKEHPKEAKRIFRTCQICNKEFKLQHHLISHIASNHDQNNKFPCPVENCPYRLKSETVLSRHVAKEHSTEEQDNHRTCKVCNKEFDKPYEVRNHIASSHDEGNKFPCPVENCPYRLKSENDLSLHVAKEHCTEKQDNLRTCQICNKEFDKPYEVRNHIASSHDEKNKYPCPVENCQYRLKSEKGVSRHVTKEHSTEEQDNHRTCKVCNKKFDKPCELRKHRASSHHEKKVCDKSLKNTNPLKKCQRSHKAERPFECSTCHKKFRKKRSLKKHQKKHVKESLINENQQGCIDIADASEDEAMDGSVIIQKQHNKSRPKSPTDKSVLITEDDSDRVVNDIILPQPDKYISESLGENIRDHVNQNTRGLLPASGQIANDAIPPTLSLSAFDANPNRRFTHFGSSTGSNNPVPSNRQAAGINNNNSSNRWNTHSGVSQNMLDNNFQPINHGTLNPTGAVNQRPMRGFSYLPSSSRSFVARQKQRNYHRYPAPQRTNKVDRRHANLASSTNISRNRNTMHTAVNPHNLENVNTLNAPYSSDSYQPNRSVQTNASYPHSPSRDLRSNGSISITHNNTYPHSIDRYNTYNQTPTSSGHNQQYRSVASSTYTLNCHDTADDLDNFSCMAHDFDTESISNGPKNLSHTDNNIQSSSNNFPTNYRLNHPTRQVNTNFQTGHTYQTNNQNNSSNGSYNTNVQKPNNRTHVSNIQSHVYTTPQPPFDTFSAPASNHTYPQNTKSNHAPQHTQLNHTNNSNNTNNNSAQHTQPSHTHSSACNQTNTAAGSGDNAFSVAPSNNQTNSVQANNQDVSTDYGKSTDDSTLLDPLSDLSFPFPGFPLPSLNNFEEWEASSVFGAIKPLRDFKDTASMASFNFNSQSYLRTDDTNSFSLAGPSFIVEPTPSPPYSSFFENNTEHNSLSTSHKDKLPAHADGTKISPADFKSIE